MKIFKTQPIYNAVRLSVFLFSFLLLTACGSDSDGGGSDDDGSGITDTPAGITLRVRPVASEIGLVEVTWSVSNETLATGANDFALQLFVDGRQQWLTQVGTDEPTDNGIPVLLRGVPTSFCFRMIATASGDRTILGSGKSGNTFPCI